MGGGMKMSKLQFRKQSSFKPVNNLYVRCEPNAIFLCKREEVPVIILFVQTFTVEIQSIVVYILNKKNFNNFNNKAVYSSLIWL